MKPSLGITMGDPAGIGPEIIAKAFASGDWATHCRGVVIGDAGVLRQACRPNPGTISRLICGCPLSPGLDMLPRF
jgi:4-hydroxy-L-threonine phosphate dehydrogenase PdxA